MICKNSYKKSIKESRIRYGYFFIFKPQVVYIFVETARTARIVDPISRRVGLNL